MRAIDWLNFLALANIIVYLWVFRSELSDEGRVTALRDALRLRPGHLPRKCWWVSFLLCLSYRLGGSAGASPEALAYGVFPTLLIALLMIDLAEERVRAYADKLRGEYRRARRRAPARDPD